MNSQLFLAIPLFILGVVESIILNIYENYCLFILMLLYIVVAVVLKKNYFARTLTPLKIQKKFYQKIYLVFSFSLSSSYCVVSPKLEPSFD